MLPRYDDSEFNGRSLQDMDEWGENLKKIAEHHRQININKDAKSKMLKTVSRGVELRNVFKKKQKEKAEKKKRDDEEAAHVYQEYVESFTTNQSQHQSASFVKGGVYNPNNTDTNNNSNNNNNYNNEQLYSSNNRVGLGAANSLMKSSATTSNNMSTAPMFVKSSTSKQETIKPLKFHMSSTISSSTPTSNKINKKKPLSKRPKMTLESVFGDDLVINMPKKRKKGVKQIDSFLQEIKMKQENKVDDVIEAPVDGSTNVFVSNIHPYVTEDKLLQLSRNIGTVSSVKIMWPRSEREFYRFRNTGFINFTSRNDADKAIRQLSGIRLYNKEILMTWAKSTENTSKMAFVGNANNIIGGGGSVANLFPYETVPVTGGFVESVEEGGPLIIQNSVAIPLIDVRPELRSPHYKQHHQNYNNININLSTNEENQIIVKIPNDHKQQELIDLVATCVVENGSQFEATLEYKEADNIKFAFLFNRHDPDRIYYRWRVYSLSQRDTLDDWRLEPFKMFENGPLWIPPPLSNLSKRSINNNVHILRSNDREKFQFMLKNITMNRQDIMECMGFALDHALECNEIVDMIVQSIIESNISFQIRLARLFVISDILYNTNATVKNASAYRSEFQAQLKKVFTVLHKSYKAIKGRITANTIRERVLMILRVWQAWNLFPDKFCSELEDIFLFNEEKSSKAIDSVQQRLESVQQRLREIQSQNAQNIDNLTDINTKQNSETTIIEENNDKTKTMDTASINNVLTNNIEEDMDGESMDEDIDGVPMDEDIDGVPMDEDIDGVPMDEDIDGVPMDEDIDGEPLN